ncbi:protoporphyrinogen oxidase [Luteococcus sp. Sow4_B9]|uniref:protoporphyrinogen oxidase n=1 Tax=Luteococcus sp. Sow4_B9 TaxID=3438792 RepID=UPI003F952842
MVAARRVVVVGAGVTGLVAARELAKDESLEVICLEASDRVGGQLNTIEVDGAHVDVGAEAIHLGAPHVAALVRELGLDADVIGAAPGSSVLATRKGLRPLPAGVGPTGPTKILPVLKSGILSPLGLIRAGLEPLMARRRFPDDMGVGEFTARRFGREVTDTFVDPLLGNLHGGDIRHLSLQSTAAQLTATAAEGQSMLLKTLKPAKGAAPAPSGSVLPMFASWPEGLSTFTRALATQTKATIRTGCPATGLTHVGSQWQVHLADGETVTADHVLVTTPSAASAALLRGSCPEAVELYEGVPTASVATVLLGWERDDVANNPTLRDANGILLPSNRARTFKAATNLTRKWPTLTSRHHLLRASVGRDGNSLADDLSDDQLTSRVAAELGELIGLTAAPQVRAVHRWPHSMPQLRPGHKARVARARAALATLGGITIAGCSVDGLGIGSTVASGQRAARDILSAMKDTNEL